MPEKGETSFLCRNFNTSSKYSWSWIVYDFPNLFLKKVWYDKSVQNFVSYLTFHELNSWELNHECRAKSSQLEFSFPNSSESSPEWTHQLELSTFRTMLKSNWFYPTGKFYQISISRLNVGWLTELWLTWNTQNMKLTWSQPRKQRRFSSTCIVRCNSSRFVWVNLMPPNEGTFSLHCRMRLSVSTVILRLGGLN